MKNLQKRFAKKSEGFKRDTEDFKETSERVRKHSKMLLNQFKKPRLIPEHSKLSERSKKPLQNPEWLKRFSKGRESLLIQEIKEIGCYRATSIQELNKEKRK